MGWIGDNISRATNAVSSGLNRATTAVSNGAKAGWKATPRPVKGLGLASLVAAAATGLIAYDAISGNNRRGKRFDPNDVPVQPIPPLLTPQDLMSAPMMPQEMGGPAEGYGANQWRNMVSASRGQAPELSAVQPRMSAIDPDAVKDLGQPTIAV